MDFCSSSVLAWGVVVEDKVTREQCHMVLNVVAACQIFSRAVKDSA